MLRNAMGLGGWGTGCQTSKTKKHCGGVLFNVTSVTRGWTGWASNFQKKSSTQNLLRQWTTVNRQRLVVHLQRRRQLWVRNFQ